VDIHRDPDLIRPTVARARIRKRGAGSRHPEINFDEGLDVVDLRKAETVEKAPLPTAQVNDLPDSAFLYIRPGGKKDAEGKTTPRTNRMFPVRDASGKLDLPRVRNAIARAPQANLPAEVKAKIQAEARKLLESTKKDTAKAAPAEIQSLIMSKETFPTAAAAKKWATDHDFRADKVDETGDSFRLRQADPGDFQRLRTITLDTGVKATTGPRKAAKKSMDVDTFMAHMGLVPAVLTWDAVRKSALDVDEDGTIQSGLPPSLENDVPPAFRYWKCSTQEDALAVREALVETQIFRPETVREVNGEIRRAIAEQVIKLYLPPVFDADQEPEVPAAIRPVEKAAGLLAPTEEDTPTTLFDQDVVEAVGLDAIVSKVGDLRGEWVICAKDTEANRKVIAGPAFRLLSRDDLIFATNAEIADPGSVEWVTGSRPEEILKFALQEDREIRLIKAEGEERIVFGVVLEPDEVDSQGDTIPAEEIRQAAHKFMEDFGQLGLQHKEIVNGKLKLLESFIAPIAFKVGEEQVKAGSWLMKERVVDDALWSDVKKGALTGFSIGGSAIRKPVKR